MTVGEYVIAILGIIVGGVGLWKFFEFLIARQDAKKAQKNEVLKRLEKIEDKLEKAERDSCRSQMIQLMTFFPDDRSELMRLSQHYFVDLHGNWYMTTLFRKHMKKHDMELPDWWSTTAQRTLGEIQR